MTADELAADISPSLFMHQRSLLVFNAIVSLRARHEPVDFITVQEQLRVDGTLEHVGGATFVTDLEIKHKHPLSIAKSALEQLRQFSLTRETHALLKESAASLSLTDPLTLLSEMRSRIDRVIETQPTTRRPMIEFRSPDELRRYEPPEAFRLVGDCHITRGSVFAIGGCPGVGKSRASVALARAGATMQDWFGLHVHRKFRTLILQNENGEFRLSRELEEHDCEQLNDYLLISPPPPFGFAFEREEFRAELQRHIRNFKPDLVILDPWNAAARDEKAQEYLRAFELIRSVVPAGDNSPALGIVAHTRKPRADERVSGRGLLNLLSGSYVLGSVPRCVFVMQHASDDSEETRIVWTCAKNNDGQLGTRSAWERRNGLFAPINDFNFEQFDNPSEDSRIKIAEEDLRAVFNGKSRRKSEAARLLEEHTGASRAACYNALKCDGRFSGILTERSGGMLSVHSQS